MQINNSELPAEGNIRVTITISDDAEEIDFHQMFGCWVGTYWLQKIADNISQLHKLDTLNFAQVDIGDSELKIIAQMVERCSSLTSVYLDKCCVDTSASGYQALEDAIKLKSSQEIVVSLFVYEPTSAMRCG